MLAAHESHGVDVEQQRRGAAVRCRFGIEDVNATETQVERLRPGRVLVQQEAQICGGGMAGRDSEQHEGESSQLPP